MLMLKLILVNFMVKGMFHVLFIASLIKRTLDFFILILARMAVKEMIRVHVQMMDMLAMVLVVLGV